ESIAPAKPALEPRIGSGGVVHERLLKPWRCPRPSHDSPPCPGRSPRATRSSAWRAAAPRPGSARRDSAGARAWRPEPPASNGWTPSPAISPGRETASLWDLHVREFECETAGAPALGMDDRRELVHSLLHVPVDDQVFVLPPGGDLLAGAAEPALDLAWRITLALTQPRIEIGQGRGHDEHGHRLRIPLTQLAGAV